MKETHVILNGHHQMYLALHCCSFGTGVHLYNNLHCILCIKPFSYNKPLIYLRKVKHFCFKQHLSVIFVDASRTGTPPVPLRSTWQLGSAVWKSSGGCSPLAEGPRWRPTVELYLLITLQPVETSPV